MKKILPVIVLFLSTQSLAGGGEWLMEFQCDYQGKTRTVYMPVWDVFNLHEDELIRDKNSFRTYFDSITKNNEFITVYNSIVDQQKISDQAGFPIHSYLLNQKSKEELAVKWIKNLQLIKIWARSDYGVNVLTQFEDEDLSWISSCKKQNNYGFDDVGCRIELYSKDGVKPSDKDVKKLYELVGNDGDELTNIQLRQLESIVAKLKKRKIHFY